MIIILWGTFIAQGQNLLTETFEGCDTSYFSVEKDSITIEPVEDFIEVLIDNADLDIIRSVRGVLTIQVLVDKKGRSCLLSAENNTNLPMARLGLKSIIDRHLFWQWPDEDTSVMIAMNFHDDSVQFVRIGLSEEEGFHSISN